VFRNQQQDIGTRVAVATAFTTKIMEQKALQRKCFNGLVEKISMKYLISLV